MLYLVILITAGTKKEAQKIARSLLSHRLAACVNVVPQVESLFWWKGKIDNAKEALLIVKTKAPLFKKLMLEVRRLHSYKCPEIIALPITKGSKDYLRWLDEITNNT